MGATAATPEIDDRDLVSAVRRICGDSAAAALCEAHGGQRIYVPQHPRPDSPLAEILGFEGLTTVVREFGWGNHSIPMHAHRRRAEAILQRSLAGVPINTIARELNCSVRHVSAVRASLRAAGKIGAPRRGSSKPSPHTGQVAGQPKASQ